LTFRQSRLQWDQPPREGESGQVSKPSHLVFSLSLSIFVSSRRGAPHTFLANAATVFQSDGRLYEAELRIAEMERQIGRQTMELEAVKKALSISSSASLRNGRL